MMSFAAVQRILGLLLTVFSFTLVPPFILSLVVRDGAATAFASAFGLTLGIGLLSWLVGAVVALPIGKLLSDAVGVAFLEEPLNYTFSTQGTLLWLAIVLVLAALASILLGALLVVIGLTLFVRGLEMGLFPIGESLAIELAGSGSLPSNIKSIRVTIFKNNTTETGLENVITNDIIYEFTRKKKDAIKDNDQAEGILSGIIKSVRTDTIARQGQSTSLTRRVYVTVNVKLTNRTGGVIWSVNGITESEAYDVTSDKPTTERRKRDAIDKASKLLAENIFNRLTEDF